MVSQTRTLKEILEDSLASRGLTIPRLAELTDIPERYVHGICEGDAKRLPPAPYIRGYLTRIGDLLGLDGQSLWRLYREEFPVKTSGISDRLPSNRFVVKPRGKAWIFIIIGLLVIIYGVWRLPELLGKPSFELRSPEGSPAIVRESPVTLTGRINPRDTLKIDNEVIPVDGDGNFEKEWSLDIGLNTIEFVVKRFLGKEIKVSEQIIYQP